MEKNIMLNGEISEADKNILSKYVEIAGVIFVVLDRDGNIVCLNQELANVVKMEVKDIRGKNWFDVFLPEKDKSWIKNVFDNLMSGSLSQSTEFMENNIITSKGEERTILWHNALIRDKNEKIYGTISSGIDVTDRMRMEKEQRLIIDILRLLNRTDSKIDLIKEILKYIKDHSGFDAVGIRLKDKNDYPYYETIGFSDDFVKMENFLCTHRKKDTSPCNLKPECICGAVISGKTLNIKNSLITEKGTFYTNNTEELLNNPMVHFNFLDNIRGKCCSEGYKSVALIPIKAGAENIGLLQLNDKRPYMFKNGFIKFYENVVESIGIALYRINIEEKIKMERDRAERANRELEDFAFKASHDLREPLRTIISFAEILEESMEKSKCSDDKKYVDNIVGASKLLDKFIDDLLSYSKVGVTIEKDSVDLNEICGIVEKKLHSLKEEKNGSIIYDNLPVIKHSKVLMIQLFQNLISNGMKYSKDDVPPIIKITHEKISNGVVIKISDNGIGIAEKNKKLIFKLFERIHPNKYRGTGMGLAICKKIVETYGGQIWFDSVEGEGTNFFFTILES